MSTTDFLSPINIKLLWEVIINEDILKNKTKKNIEQIADIFNSLIKEFYEKEKSNSHSLTDINKKYISLMINYILHTFSKNEDVKPFLNKVNITSEEIKNDRMSYFEKELNEKKKNFMDAISPKIPEKIDFSDKIVDEPLMYSEKIISQTIYKRNQEEEEFQKNISKNQVNSKLINKNVSGGNQFIKYIKIGDDVDNNIEREVIDLNEEYIPRSILKKSLTWENDNTSDSENDLFFSKLKLTNETNNENSIEITNEINDTNTKLELDEIKSDIKNMYNLIYNYNEKIDKLINIIENLNIKLN
jgi:hypothetical protein